MDVNKIKKDTLLILDEGDWYLLDKIGKLPNTFHGIIALTATVVGIDGGNEIAYLKQEGFQMNDSKIPPNFDPEEILLPISDDAFASKSRTTRARLIWCTEDKVEHFKKKMETLGYRVRTNHREIGDLRKLEKDDCLLVT